MTGLQDHTGSYYAATVDDLTDFPLLRGALGVLYHHVKDRL